jgi:hypothetical protein
MLLCLSEHGFRQIEANDGAGRISCGESPGKIAGTTGKIKADRRWQFGESRNQLIFPAGITAQREKAGGVIVLWGD